MARGTAYYVALPVMKLSLSGAALCAPVGSLPTDTKMGNVSGLGEVCTPAWPAMSFPDFLFYSGTNAYLIFRGSYDDSDWTNWADQVKHYQIGIQMANWSCWFGIWVAGRGDINDDGDNDVLIGDTRHLNYKAWDKNYGICYALYNIGEPARIGRTELDLDEPGTMATVAKITTDQVQSRFGCCSEIVGDVNGDDYGDILIGES